MTGTITQCISFYSLPSSVIGHAKHDCLNAAYLLYYAYKPEAIPEDVSDGESQLLQALVSDAMTLAKNVRLDSIVI